MDIGDWLGGPPPGFDDHHEDFDDLVDAEEEHYRQLQEDNASQQDVDQILQELGEEGQGTVRPSQQKVPSDAANSQKLTQSHQLPAGLANPSASDKNSSIPHGKSAKENVDTTSSLEVGSSPDRKRPKLDAGVTTDPFAETVLTDISNKKSRGASKTYGSHDTDDLDVLASQIPRYRVPQIGERKVWRRRPTGRDYLSVTTAEGDRYYLRMVEKKDEEDEEESFKAWTPQTSAGGRGDQASNVRGSGLCGRSYGAIYNEALVEQSKVRREAEGSSDLIEEEAPSSSNVAPPIVGHQDSNNNTAVLWVEKFRPKNFIELLSDDGTNRTLLRWLKLWDKAVFNREPKAKPPKPEDLNKGDGKFQPGGGGGGKFQKFNANNEVIEELDKDGRPVQKVALLHGPPGLGKTTLGHVLAATAGYVAVEMNASDDRSKDKFKEKFEASTQMKAVTRSKPNCLIIDEIDGSPAPTINFLVQALKKSKLMRPVICICNDLYVPALRPLRQLSLLVPFPPTLSSRLVQRLQEIAQAEKLRADQTALLALAEKSENDIRSCLATLQFFKSRGKPLKMVDVHKSQIGQKDSHKSHFTVWKEMFAIPRTSSKRKYVGSDGDLMEENLSQISSRFKNMLATAQSCGDNERIMQGLFENYLEVKFKDNALHNVICGTEWFTFFDVAQHYINSSQNYSAMKFLPYTFVASHLLFASSTLHKVKYPSAHFEATSATQKSSNTIEMMVAEMAPTTRVFMNPSVLLLDTLPLLLEVIKPNIRAVNTQLYSAKEKEELRALVSILLAFNLNFVQERTPDGQYAYRLDPPVECVAHFPDIPHKQLPYAIKQLISHEVEVEKMRREEGQPTPLDTKTSEDKKSEGSKKEGKGDKSAVPNHLNQKLKAKAVVEKAVIPTDFFGRQIAPKAKTAGEVKNSLLSNDIWFKFKEGYSNAVRRTIRLQDLV